jgi:hypothetical protein
MSQRRRMFRSPIPVELIPSESDSDAPIEAAEAWKAVGLVNEWVRHAEAKAVGVLATAGVVAGVLYNLVKDQTEFGYVVKFFGTGCGALAFLAAACAVVALWPRLWKKGPATSALYFDHIARRYPKDEDGVRYVEELRSLLSNPNDLLAQLGQQVWANARVARRKYLWAGWGMAALFAAMAALAVVALRLGLMSMGVWNG